MKTLLRIALLAVAAAAVLYAADVPAQVVTSQFTVSATVARNCRIDAATDIFITTAAAGWDPTSTANPTQTGTISVRCTKGTSYTIELNKGVHTDVLTHSNGTDTLPFKFYRSDCATDFSPITVLATSRQAQATTVCAGLDLTQTALLDAAIAGTYTKSVFVDVSF